jgi:hypothetical protein
MRVDELPAWSCIRELLPEPADINVHRAVARSERSAPRVFGQLFAACHGTGASRKGDEETELVAREVERRRTIDDGHVLGRADLQGSGAENLGKRGFHVDARLPGAPPIRVT